jgi:hypothetical protein
LAAFLGLRVTGQFYQTKKSWVMKTIFLTMKRSFLFIAIPMLSMLFLVACSKDDNNNNGGNDEMYTTQGDAFGGQQNPPVATTGNARLVGSYNATINKWEYSIDWSSLMGAATLIEFHGPADIGVNGAILFSVEISAGGNNGARSSTVILTEQQEDWLLDSKIYYTILTTAHVTGEVRGQVYTVAR